MEPNIFNTITDVFRHVKYQSTIKKSSLSLLKPKHSFIQTVQLLLHPFKMQYAIRSQIQRHWGVRNNLQATHDFSWQFVNSIHIPTFPPFVPICVAELHDCFCTDFLVPFNLQPAADWLCMKKVQCLTGVPCWNNPLSLAPLTLYGHVTGLLREFSRNMTI